MNGTLTKYLNGISKILFVLQWIPTFRLQGTQFSYHNDLQCVWNLHIHRENGIRSKLLEFWEQVNLNTKVLDVPFWNMLCKKSHCLSSSSSLLTWVFLFWCKFLVLEGPGFPKLSSSLMPLPERRDKVKLILIYRSSKEDCLILKAFFAISPFEILEILSLRSIVSCANFELLQLDGDYCLVRNHLHT